jgi:hypothetical protein
MSKVPLGNNRSSVVLYGILGLNLLPNLNLNPESRVANVMDNHPAAVSAACATYAKGGCAAFKLVKAGASATMSSAESENTQSRARTSIAESK